jgi:hypothetical protein
MMPRAEAHGRRCWRERTRRALDPFRRWRARTTIQPCLEVSQNLLAELKPGDDVLTYTAIAAGVDVALNGRNTQGRCRSAMNGASPKRAIPPTATRSRASLA